MDHRDALRNPLASPAASQVDSPDSDSASQAKIVRSDLGAWAPWFAILSASSWLIALITISLFFAIGQPWGTINDVASFVQWAAAIPLVIVIYQSQRAQAPLAPFVALLGLAALV